mmetsp:Transcript_13432/g.9676  ORF Transcript_13432/g.9676 Transcript_13432/m.9676 type:complete len:90 (-) Transcript_13432:86-355(-)
MKTVMQEQKNELKFILDNLTYINNRKGTPNKLYFQQPPPTAPIKVNNYYQVYNTINVNNAGNDNSYSSNQQNFGTVSGKDEESKYKSIQ